jgi:hypothetical protein
MTMNEYEVRLYRADDMPSPILKTAAGNLAETEEMASAMLKEDIVREEVWGSTRKLP